MPLFEFLFNSLPGLCLVAVGIIVALCLAATPFIIIKKLTEIHGKLEQLQSTFGGDQDRYAQPLETINRNVGFLVLNLPKMMKEGR